MARKIVKRAPKQNNESERVKAPDATEQFSHDMTAIMLFFAKQYSIHSGRSACDFNESDIDAAMEMKGTGNWMPTSWLHELRKVQS